MSPRRNIMAAIATVVAVLAIASAIVARLLPPNAAPAPAASPSDPDTRLKVVASFSILGDMAARVGGDRIELTVLVGAGGDTHAYEPSPADARAIASADVVVVNGLGFEGWIDRLIEASDYGGPVVVASRGVRPIRLSGGSRHGHGTGDAAHRHDHPHAPSGGPFGSMPDFADPHAWQSVANAKVYVANIAAAFAAVDPEGVQTYVGNATDYRTELDSLERSIAGELALLPADRRTVVTSHAAFGYFGTAYGLDFVAPQGFSTQTQPSAREVAALIALIRKRRISALFLESITDPRLLHRIAEETGARSGGTLYSDSLSPPGGPAATYVAMMQHNASVLAAALAPPAR